MRKQYLFILVLLAVLPLGLSAQGDSTSIYKKRRNLLLVGGLTGYAGSMTFLYHSWYKNYEQSSFHFIDDSGEWMLQDKAGHVITTYYLTHYASQSYRWAGYRDAKAVWMAGATGFLYQTVIEVLDGFSAKWGASSADLIANTTGSLLYIGQNQLWGEQRIIPKYSYHDTQYPDYRPDLLGSNLPENMLKDYNAQTFWLSANLNAIMPRKTLPPWLNLAAGYNAYGMTGGEKNASSYNGNPIPEFERTARFLLAPDIDFKQINPDSRVLNFIFGALRFFKMPAPALEYNTRKGLRFHLIYF